MGSRKRGVRVNRVRVSRVPTVFYPLFYNKMISKNFVVSRGLCILVYSLGE